jgi:hypothetical protein
MSLFTESSLCLVPSGVKDGKTYSIKPTDGSGDLTFSRGSDIEATKVGSDGFIHKAQVNLLLQSNTFSTTWSNTRSTESSGYAGYDGTNDAWLLESTATAQSARVFQSITKSYVHTMSVYAKAGTSSWVALLTDGNQQAYFDLANGLVGSTSGSDVIDSNIEAVGATGWYRCSATFNGNDAFSIFIANGDGDATTNSGDNIYIQDAQLNYGLVAQEYQETTTTSVITGITNDMPRLDYSGGASCPSLLLEPSRQNLVPQSEYYGGSEWTKANVDLTDNSATSPEGVTNAAKLAESASGSSLRAVFEQFTPSLGTYTFSGFLKQGSLQYGGIRAIVNGGANRFFVNVNLSTGTITDTDIVGSGVTWTYGIEDYGNGWHRLWISAAHSVAGFVDLTYALSNSATPTYTSALPIYNGSGSDYNFIYGAQIESASYPSSMIPTYGTSATRTADECSKTGISSLIGQSEGTIFIQVNSSDHISEVSDGTSANRIVFYTDGSDYLRTLIRASGSTSSNVQTNTTIQAGDKIALAYANNDSVIYKNGVQIGSDTSVTIPATSKVNVGSDFNENFTTTNSVNQFILFPTRLSNADLATLTA